MRITREQIYNNFSIIDETTVRNKSGKRWTVFYTDYYVENMDRIKEQLEKYSNIIVVVLQCQYAPEIKRLGFIFGKRVEEWKKKKTL